jgi:hypothetical protein
MACACEANSTTDLSSRTFTPVPLASLSRIAVASAAVAEGGSDVIQTYHSSAFGDQLVSSQNPRTGTVDIKGNLGFIEVDLTIGVAVTNNAVTVSVEVREPVKVGPQQWTFNITGATLTRQTAPSTSALMASSFDWSCILKCGGDKILPILVGCLPSLIGGPQAFISCAIGKLAGNSSDIVKCIVSGCL